VTLVVFFVASYLTLSPSRGQDARGAKDHHDDQECTDIHVQVVELITPGLVVVEIARHELHDDRTNGDAPDRAHTAKDHEDQYVHRDLVLEERWIDVPDETRREHAAKTAARRTHGERHDLVLERVDANGLGRDLVLSNRDPCPSHPRVFERGEGHEEDDDEEEAQIIIRVGLMPQV